MLRCDAACFGECRRRRLRWVQAGQAVLLHAAVGSDEGGCAAAHCRGCKRRRLRCFLLRGQAEQAALSYVVVSAKRKRLRCVACFGGQAKEAALLHAAEDAGVRGCAPAWRGGCRQRGLRKWMLRCA